jgi:hypothetical protein
MDCRTALEQHISYSEELYLLPKSLMEAGEKAHVCMTFATVMLFAS